ncbi:MAG: RdgB/HAM1 family non-canonical purine NTP pyrophosphatase [Chitinophagaceae bacterium]|nr:RdgB/HAM1 family non-canonical purine NTP pyrophosphatase [Chitinophagaceae bacterium]
MQQLIFATNNLHKTEEVRAITAGLPYHIITLKEAGIEIDIPEPHDTLEENASEKSNVIYRLTQKNCFSEDTGLEVEALNGEPGVKSARYAGDERIFDKNIEKLLKNLKGHSNRKARFRAVVSLILEGKEYQFEGICNGIIAEAPQGSSGFGYDPVFIPDGDTRCFAEMTLAEKNQYNHRRKAIDGMLQFLKQRHIL